jgi:uncharacterized protein
MIVPSCACQAACSYCFGPHQGAVMDSSTARKTAEFVCRATQTTGQRRISITFHGGEPLLAPIEIWTVLLQSITDGLPGVKIQWSMQSNLIALDHAKADLLRRYGVSVGTSIDGPREICDRVRGQGYWERNRHGLALAREHGLDVGGIATIARETLGDFPRVAAFFAEQGLSMNLHPALGSLDHPDSCHALSPAEYAALLREAVELGRRESKTLHISTIGYFVRALMHGDPQVCTFKDCLGMFLAIDPAGYVYPCQRFCGRPQLALGKIEDDPASLLESPVAHGIRARQDQVSERCQDCEYLTVCRGGCYYNAVATGDGIVDPMCQAYRATFDHVRQRLLDEAASAENLDAIADRPPRSGEHPLFRKGPLISLGQEPHPRRIAESARAILSLHALARFGDAGKAARHVVDRRICGDVERTEHVMRQHQCRLRESAPSRNNLYVHVTFACNLRCTHCYAEAGGAKRFVEPEAFERLVGEARAARFRQVVVTGGEPLIHPGFCQIAESCRRARGSGVNLVLRTNLTGDHPDSLLIAIAESFDQVVASVDGDGASHDRRRGAGTHASVTRNVERYQALCVGARGAAEMSLACCMDAASINGEPGSTVRELAAHLGIRRTRFRPLLPLGRAASMTEPVMCEGLHAHLGPEEMLKQEFRPILTCGLGQNLYVEPDGNAFPCYAYHRPHSWLGNVFEQGLAKVLDSQGFRDLAGCTVDTIEKCQVCEFRYLCGGACRAWGGEASQQDIHAAPPNCEHLQSRARALLLAAEAYLRT